jgi:dihydrodipicolinate synthase/N-acetylneuraminate lyase
VGDEAAMKKLPYRLVSLGLSVVSGMLAGALFKGVWKLVARQEDAPDATDLQRSWKEVLPAAALQGAIFATVKAAVERGALQGGRKMTGSNPGG